MAEKGGIPGCGRVRGPVVHTTEGADYAEFFQNEEKLKTGTWPE